MITKLLIYKTKETSDSLYTTGVMDSWKSICEDLVTEERNILFEQTNMPAFGRFSLTGSLKFGKKI